MMFVKTPRGEYINLQNVECVGIYELDEHSWQVCFYTLLGKRIWEGGFDSKQKAQEWLEVSMCNLSGNKPVEQPREEENGQADS